jgi:hypothetical protein
MEGSIMGQVRHGSATTTHAVRAAIQRSQASLAQLSQELGINPKTMAKWRKRATVEDRKTGPTEPRSTVLSAAEEAAIVAFRRHTLLPLDDCLYALQPSIRCCQTNANQSLFAPPAPPSGSKKSTPFGQGGGAVQFESLSAVEGAFLIEMVVDRGMDRDEFLQRSHASESQHRSFSPSKWQVRVLGAIVGPAAGFLSFRNAQFA